MGSHGRGARSCQAAEASQKRTAKIWEGLDPNGNKLVAKWQKKKDAKTVAIFKTYKDSGKVSQIVQACDPTQEQEKEEVGTSGRGG